MGSSVDDQGGDGYQFCLWNQKADSGTWRSRPPRRTNGSQWSDQRRVSLEHSQLRQCSLSRGRGRGCSQFRDFQMHRSRPPDKQMEMMDPNMTETWTALRFRTYLTLCKIASKICSVSSKTVVVKFLHELFGYQRSKLKSLLSPFVFVICVTVTGATDCHVAGVNAATPSVASACVATQTVMGVLYETAYNTNHAIFQPVSFSGRQFSCATSHEYSLESNHLRGWDDGAEAA